MKHLRHMLAATQHANNPPNEKPIKEEKYFTWRSTSLVVKLVHFYISNMVKDESISCMYIINFTNPINSVANLILQDFPTYLKM